MPITFRPAMPTDAVAVAAVHASSMTEAFASFLPADFLTSITGTFPDKYEKQLATANPSSTAVLVVAVDTMNDGSEVIAGICTVGTTRDNPVAIKGLYVYELRCIYVSSAYHGQGLAKKLFQEAARAFGVPVDAKIFCNVFLKNQRAIGFYKKLGAVEVYREPNTQYSVEPEVIVTLEWARMADIFEK
ncbi:hypothetical protein ACHHYP_00926 [Achlya hypogyna]|uniref:N-acetyltransferase domain-containing protein n=1 Tax=Achlya hypogyna TaxID=1202772 RepID=A0A1V9Z9V0_ACHHY|nr:hypothetical protein ACHHYP_00926 [Achlya hypogyna]